MSTQSRRWLVLGLAASSFLFAFAAAVLLTTASQSNSARETKQGSLAEAQKMSPDARAHKVQIHSSLMPAGVWQQTPHRAFTVPGSNVQSDFEQRRSQQAGPAIVMAEEFEERGAVEILMDSSVERAQRNEAASYLREHHRDIFLLRCEDLLRRSTESDLFKSWLLQHLGVIAPGLPNDDSRLWGGRIGRLVADANVGSPIWREAIYALSYFRDEAAKERVTAILSSLSKQQRIDLEPLLRDVRKNLALEPNSHPPISPSRIEPSDGAL